MEPRPQRKAYLFRPVDTYIEGPVLRAFPGSELLLISRNLCRVTGAIGGSHSLRAIIALWPAGERIIDTANGLEQKGREILWCLFYGV